MAMTEVSEQSPELAMLMQLVTEASSTAFPQGRAFITPLRIQVKSSTLLRCHQRQLGSDHLIDKDITNN
jgi:hypothetical protein